MGAVIDASAFKTNKEYIDYAKASEDAEVICGGYDDSKGYFVYPTLIEAKKPDFKTMVEEIFGPVMTVYVYPDDKLDETLASCDTATSYGLSGAIFADDREAIVKMEDALKGTAGNFYNWCSYRSAAVRWCKSIRNQRQSRKRDQHVSLVKPENHQRT